MFFISSQQASYLECQLHGPTSTVETEAACREIRAPRLKDRRCRRSLVGSSYLLTRSFRCCKFTMHPNLHYTRGLDTPFTLIPQLGTHSGCACFPPVAASKMPLIAPLREDRGQMSQTAVLHHEPGRFCCGLWKYGNHILCWPSLHPFTSLFHHVTDYPATFVSPDKLHYFFVAGLTKTLVTPCTIMQDVDILPVHLGRNA